MGRPPYSTQAQITALSSEGVYRAEVIKTTDLAPMTSELDFVYPRDGYVGEIISINCEYEIPDGATNGNHFVEYYDNLGFLAGMLSIDSNFDEPIQYAYGELISQSTTRPSDAVGRVLMVKGTRFSKEYPVKINYYNGTNGVSKSRKYVVIYREIKIK